MANFSTLVHSFTVGGVAVRVPMAGLNIDALREALSATAVNVINQIPEDQETGVPKDDLVRLHVVSILNVNLDPTVQVYLTRSSDSIRVLAYDQAAGGFQTGFSGTFSSATYQSSPGAAVTDELLLVIDPQVDWTSLEVIIVEVVASAGGPSETFTYSFTVEDLTSPLIESILWLNPRKARIKWNEPVDDSSDPGGACFTEHYQTTEILSTSTVRVRGVAVSSAWIGYWAAIAGSAYPGNNQWRLITGVDTDESTLTLSTSLPAGPMTVDDGIDRNDSGVVARRRSIRLSVTPYRLLARLTEEGGTFSPYSAERIQCAFLPLPISCSTPEDYELPVGADPQEYTVIDFHDDISFGRLYTITAKGVADFYDNATAGTEELDFQTPMFGLPTNRIGFWSDGVTPPTDRTDDLENGGGFLRRLAVIFQDLLNSLWYRIDQIQYLDDPARCPDEWVPHLLYNLGNPFRFDLPATYHKRRLAAALPGFYKRIGTATGIQDMLFLLLGIQFDIEPYATADAWILGDPVYGILGQTTVLAPGTKYQKNCYEVISPVLLTDDERRIVRDVCEWSDPIWMHLARIVEP